MLAFLFDRAAGFYDRTRGYSAGSTKKVLKILEARLRGSGRVIDLGVGTGRFALPLQRRGIDVVAVDVSRPMLFRAVAKGCGSAVLADALNLPFADGVFEAAVGVHMLHLIPDWRGVLSEVARTVRGEFLTVFDTLDCLGIDPHEEYRRLASRSIRCSYPSPHESDLIPRVKPVFLEHVATDRKPVDGVLQAMREKSFSYQWSVPDLVHHKTMRGIDRLAGNVLTCKIYVCAWKIRDIADFLRI